MTNYLPPPPSHDKHLFRNADILNLLEEFENNPEGVFNHPRLKPYVLELAVRDYDTDHLSKKIIDHCLEYCADTNYARYNTVNLIERIVDM